MKISGFSRVRSSYDHTFRFQVSVDEAHEMEVFQCRRHLGRVESGIFLRNTFPRTSL